MILTSMPTVENNIVLGLTGSVGSRCSTMAKALQDMGFRVYSLSKLVKKVWEDRNPGKQAEKDAKRCELQDLGNELRKTNKNNGYLAIETIKKADAEEAKSEKIVFDNIRHTGEIKALRQRYPDFI
jgi:dephospho-CoA kinase